MGLPNPYRLRPFLGARVPLNFSFSTVINMHNPYDSPLQVSRLIPLSSFVENVFRFLFMICLFCGMWVDAATVAIKIIFLLTEHEVCMRES